MLAASGWLVGTASFCATTDSLRTMRPAFGLIFSHQWFSDPEGAAAMHMTRLADRAAEQPEGTRNRVSPPVRSVFFLLSVTAAERWVELNPGHDGVMTEGTALMLAGVRTERYLFAWPSAPAAQQL